MQSKIESFVKIVASYTIAGAILLGALVILIPDPPVYTPSYDVECFEQNGRSYDVIRLDGRSIPVGVVEVSECLE